MNRKILSLMGVLFAFCVVSAFAQQTEAPAAQSLPAATRSEIDCAGFIAAARMPDDVYVFDGADNDFRSPFKHFTTGDLVYLHGNTTAGTEYSLIRPAKSLFNVSWYGAQPRAMRSLGHPYEDLGRVKVIRLTPQGAVAEVTFSCGSILPGDLAVPFQARAIPEYTPSQSFDRFAQTTSKVTGAITAAGDNAGYLGAGSIAYLNLGTVDAVRVGQRFRIFHVTRERIQSTVTSPRPTPREFLGELVVLITREKSSSAMVVNSIRGIQVGDGVELE